MIIGAALLSARIVQAEDLAFDMYPTPFLRAEPNAEVAANWPLVVQHAFTEKGVGHSGLNIYLLVPIQRGDDPLCLEEYFVGSLQRSPEGILTGRLVPNNMDYPFLSYDQIIVDPALITDWSYTPTDATRRFGRFGQRRQLGDHTEGLAEFGLTQKVIPPEWE